MKTKRELAEAVTIKAQAKGLLKNIIAVMGNKTVPVDLRKSLEGVREALKKNWADLEAEAAMPDEGECAPDDQECLDKIEAKKKAMKENTEELGEVIKKEDDGYHLYSKDGSKHLGGPYDTEEEAKKREKQVQFFKQKESGAPTLEEAYKPAKKSLAAIPVVLKLKIKEDEQALIDSFADWADGSFTKCVAALEGKEGIEDAPKLCAWLKDQATGSTDWRGAETTKENAEEPKEPL